MTTAKLCCPACGNFESKVINVRAVSDAAYVYRRRECLHCHYRYPTQERIVPHKTAPSKETHNI